MVKENLEILIDRLVHGSEEEAEAATQAIAVYGAAALPALVELSASKDPDDRWWALRSLSAVDDPGAGTLLIEGLGDPVLDVRQCAALGLFHHPDPAAIPALSAALQQEDQLLRRLAGGALAAIGDPAVPALLEVLRSGSEGSRVEAARALAMGRGPGAVPALVEALKSDSALIEFWADLGLNRRGIGMRYFKP